MARESKARDIERPLTISKLARRFKLSRSTLLYYDRIGLLQPTSQTTAGYRLYGEAALTRLARVMELRSAGLPLQTVRRILESQTPLAEALERQISTLNQQVAELRAQQRVVLALLEASAKDRRARVLSKQSWTRMFRSIGMTDADMHRWHAHFEASMPDAHRDFLESLGLDAREVRRIRDWSSRSE